MEAPENIHIQPNAHDGWFEGKIPNGLPNGLFVEYTRTDAFIEKACVKLKKLMYDSLMFQGRLYRDEAIDNFVEKFKNYMKGE